MIDKIPRPDFRVKSASLLSSTNYTHTCVYPFLLSCFVSETESQSQALNPLTRPKRSSSQSLLSIKIPSPAAYCIVQYIHSTYRPRERFECFRVLRPWGSDFTFPSSTISQTLSNSLSRSRPAPSEMKSYIV